jgi:hypothetical protein
MDDLVLENICDRVKSLIFPKGEVVSSTTNPSLYCLRFLAKTKIIILISVDA